MRVVRRYNAYFFPKKDMMFPCPGFAPFFAVVLFVEAIGADTLAFLGAGSSSEKDSHAASSRVTVMCKLESYVACERSLTEISLLVPDCLLLHHPPAPTSPTILHNH